jgi:glycosyltransferase involved in cell wall biosynthesis
MNEDGTVGGSHQAMFDLIAHLDPRQFQPVALYYQDQQFARRLVDSGVEVYTWDRQRQTERVHEACVRSLAGSVALRMRAVRERIRFLRALRIDLFHANNAPHIGYHDWLPAATVAGIPAIAHARGPYFPPSSAGKRWLARRWKRVIAISGFIEHDLLAAGFPHHRVRKVFDGVDVERFAGSVKTPRAEVRAHLGLLPEQFVVAMVGNIKRWKGQGVVLDALSLLGADLRNRIRVLFIGDLENAPASATGYARSKPGLYYEELQRTVTERCLTDCVTFLGRRQDVPDLMNAADVVVHASTKPEPFGLVVVEGMALGKPVIAANDGGPADIVVPGSGLTFDTQKPEQLAQALQRLAADPRLQVSLGTGARARAREFTIDRTVRAVEQVYRELVQ